MKPRLELRGTSVIRDYTVRVYVYGTALSPEAIFMSRRKASINIRTAASCYEHNAQSRAATSIAIKINPQIMDVRLSRRETASSLSTFTPQSKTRRRLSG